MRIYVAGQMTGLPDFNYPAFGHAARALREHGHTVVNPARGWDDQWRDAPEEPLRPPADYIRRGIVDVAGCEAVALLPGWENSRGTALEVAIADTLGLVVAPLEQYLNDEHPLFTPLTQETP